MLKLKHLDRALAYDAHFSKTHRFIQPGWQHVQQAFLDGAREARANPTATEEDFKRAADGYTKRVHEEVDPETERRLREGDWKCT